MRTPTRAQTSSISLVLARADDRKTAAAELRRWAFAVAARQHSAADRRVLAYELAARLAQLWELA